jgi:hypothetical protein
MILGDQPKRMLREFTDANGLDAFGETPETLEPGTVLLWRKNTDAAPMLVRLEPNQTERRRHLRKYAEGELMEDRSFFFRGPEGKLKLRAYNLFVFLDLADGVDDDTWLFHLRKGDFSAWLRNAIKDDVLAEQVAAIEHNPELDAATSRREIRRCIEAIYTLPTETK